jgi:hypothetical protein
MLAIFDHMKSKYYNITILKILNNVNIIWPHKTKYYNNVKSIVY